MSAPPDSSALRPPSAAAPLDLELVRNYAVAGPRYTSYPPANHFRTDWAELDLVGALAADNAPGAGPLSLYFHLPFCESRCWYCGCTTIITRKRAAAASYLDDVVREIELTVPQLDRTRPVAQLHLGGGTPTFFPPEELLRLAEAVRREFTFAPDAECSVEIDPRHVTPAHIGALRALGVNRASLGIQDTNTAVQRAIHREQPHSLNRQTVRWLRDAGIGGINLDLIYGLPLQTPATLDRTVDDVLELRPDRLSVFSYAHVPWIKPAQRIFDQRGQLPTPAAKLEMFALIRARLLAAGYVEVGLDHFARPEDELARAQRAGALHRNFQGYSTRAGASLYGFGISSISQTRDTYRQNHKSLATYRAELAAGRWPIERGYRLTEEDRRRRTLIMRIMCDRRLDFAALGEELGVDLATTYAAELAALAPLAADGLVRVDGRRLEVLPAGEPLLRVIAMRFDAFHAAGPRRHALAV